MAIVCSIRQSEPFSQVFQTEEDIVSQRICSIVTGAAKLQDI
jgi:hypothetical protein